MSEQEVVSLRARLRRVEGLLRELRARVEPWLAELSEAGLGTVERIDAELGIDQRTLDELLREHREGA